MMIKKLLAAATAAASVLCSGILPAAGNFFTASAVDNTMRDMTTMEIVKDMGLGINLGNTFESSASWDNPNDNWIKTWGAGGFPGTDPRAYETAWGSPVITKDIFHGYVEAGFDSVRIPVAWSNLMSEDGTYTISDAYLAEVRQSVDWALAEGLYVVMNLHWDGGWLENMPTDKENDMKHFTRVWEQLTVAFKDYGDHLIFESQNEELGWNSLWNQWAGASSGKADSYGLVNEVNQKFVDIVRNSGGNNAKRHLLISGYGTDVTLTCDSMFQMPNDPANRCAVSVHYYTPSPFAILEEDADWAKASSTWGTDAEIAELNNNMDLLKRTFVDKGVPVIIGEYGCPTKNKDTASVEKFLSSIAEASAKRGMCPVLWDITDLHYSRTTCKMKDSVVQSEFNRINETYFKEDASTTTTTTEPAATTTTTTTTTSTTTTTTTTNTTSTTTQPTTPVTPVTPSTGNNFRDMSTMDIVKDMGLGINLGNTFESCGDWIQQWGSGGFSGTDPRAYETAWGSPVITKNMIHGYAEAGFRSVRIPVAWSNLMANDGTYTINAAYMAEVKQSIDWALEEGLYVIMNLHWDGGWLENLPTNKTETMNRYARIWEQLTVAFRDYGDKLIFESQNEELGWNSVWNQWSGSTNGKADSYGLVNEVNQKFVDIVRSSGGNNAYRHLLISGYGTDVTLTCDSMFQMPNDPANRCAVSVHYYTPSPFAILEEDADWAKAQRTWGTDAEVAELNNNMDLLKRTFVDKGVPVIIGEYGCPTNNKEAASVEKFLSSVAEEAVKRGMCPVLWDTTDLHYSRTTCKMIDSVVQSEFDRINATYFKENSSTTEPTLLRGDINADGAVTIVDAVLLQKHLVCIAQLASTQLEPADVNADGKVNIFDLAALKGILHRS